VTAEDLALGARLPGVNSPRGSLTLLKEGPPVTAEDLALGARLPGVNSPRGSLTLLKENHDLT